MGHAGDHVPELANPLELRGQTAGCFGILEVCSRQEAHHQEGPSVGEPTGVEQGHDGGMAEPGQQRGLALQASGRGTIWGPLRFLERHCAVQLAVMRLPDASHSPLSDDPLADIAVGVGGIRAGGTGHRVGSTLGARPPWESGLPREGVRGPANVAEGSVQVDGAPVSAA